MGGDYGKGLYKQLIEQINLNEKLQKENEALRAENNELRKENKRLREKISEIEANMAEQIAIAVTEAVRQATTPLIEELNKSNTEIARLKSIINKDSTNSSKPSSTNGFKIIPNSREKKRETARRPERTPWTSLAATRKYRRT